MNKKWTTETMQQFCDDNEIDVKILNSYRVNKGYQNVLYATILLPSGEIIQRVWNNFKNHNKNTKILTKWTQERAEKFLKDNGYTLLDTFKNVDTTMKCKDKNGFIYMISITNLKRFLKTPEILDFSIIKNNPYAIYNIQTYCKLYRPDYEILSKEYVGVKNKYKFKYNGVLYNNIKERVFECTLDHFLHNDGGINMNLSKGAQKIASILQKENKYFILEKTFSDLKGYKNIPYRYDFCVKTENEEILIEYDSELHFNYIPGIHKSHSDFNSARERDRRKNNYALAHDIKLYRIPFWELDNINSFDDILNEKFLVRSMWHNDNLKAPKN